MLLLIAVAALIAVARARRDEVEREISAFYGAPQPLPPGRPGDLIRQDALEAPKGVRAWRVLYRSTTYTGAEIAVSGLVVVPDRAPPAGGFPVVAVAHGTVGSAQTCAPSLRPFASRSLVPAALSPGTSGQSFYQMMVRPFTDAGYVVAATDYQGLGTLGPNPYLVGEDAARNVLDAARLVQRLTDVPVSGATLVWGHSQGGQAAAFSGQIAPSYAPELRILGVVAGAPAAEISLIAEEVASDNGRSLLTGLVVMIARAWTAAYSDVQPSQVLTARGVHRMSVVDEQCIGGVLPAFAFRPAPDYINAAGLRLPRWQQLIAQNTPGAVRTIPPLRVFQGTSDRLIKPAFTDLFVHRLCTVGDTVAYQQYSGEGHLGVIAPSMPDTLAWMAARLAGTPVPTTC